MKKTDNYSLPQWEKQDFIKMEDFNDLTQKTDAALKANADATATGLNAEIAARGEADAAEAENRSAADAALQASLAAAIGSGGKTCRIFTGSYTGTGTSAAANPVSIACPFYPVLVVAQADGANRPLIFFRKEEIMTGQQDFGLINNTLHITWGNDSVVWYSGSSGSSAAEYGGSTRGKVYSYVVLGYDDAAE